MRWTRLCSWKQVFPIVLGVSVGVRVFDPGTVPVYAATATPAIPVVLDGKPLSFDVPPLIVNGRVMVPLRAIFESLGAKVAWNPATQTVTASKNQTMLNIPIGSFTVYKNNQPVSLDVPALIRGDRTLVPVRFVSEAFGDTVKWVDHGVVIQTPNNDTSAAFQPNSGVSIQVEAGDSAVTSQQLDLVRQTLRQGNIPVALETDLQENFQQPVTIRVSEDQQGYQSSLVKYQVATFNASTISQESNGLAYGNTMYFPFMENKNPGELKNILAHELTHILLNQNGIGSVIPSWMNEGVAWTEGLKSEYQNSSPVIGQGQIDYMRETILNAFQTNQWQPLLVNPEDTIHSTNAYDVEWQDYFAVSMLRQTAGDHALVSYLQDLQQVSARQAFQTAFGMSESAFEQAFDKQLAAWKQQADHGLKITLKVDSSFHGDIAVMPKGSQTWTMYRVSAGTYTVHVMPDGTITGLPNLLTTSLSPDAPDPNTVFISVNPDNPVQVNGKYLQRAGFAFSAKYGQAYYLNSWTVDTSEQSSFDNDISHLGVELLNIQPLS